MATEAKSERHANPPSMTMQQECTNKICKNNERLMIGPLIILLMKSAKERNVSKGRKAKLPYERLRDGSKSHSSGAIPARRGTNKSWPSTERTER